MLRNRQRSGPSLVVDGWTPPPPPTALKHRAITSQTTTPSTLSLQRRLFTSPERRFAFTQARLSRAMRPIFPMFLAASRPIVLRYRTQTGKGPQVIGVSPGRNISWFAGFFRKNDFDVRKKKLIGTHRELWRLPSSTEQQRLLDVNIAAAREYSMQLVSGGRYLEARDLMQTFRESAPSNFRTLSTSTYQELMIQLAIFQGYAASNAWEGDLGIGVVREGIEDMMANLARMNRVPLRKPGDLIALYNKSWKFREPYTKERVLWDLHSLAARHLVRQEVKKATKTYRTVLQFRNSPSIGRSPLRALQLQGAVIHALQHIIQFDTGDVSKPRVLAVVVGLFDEAMQRISDGRNELADNERDGATNNVHPAIKEAWVDLLTNVLILRASFALDSEHDPVKARKYYRLFRDHWNEHSSLFEQVPARWKTAIKKLDELERGDG